MLHSRANHLAGQTSPYLLQHIHNPVDWWPWGEAAFAEARRRDVPIFLSIGYSTCYWCHVMERESFENEAIARQMNDAFVCIKVDREERPDVDDLYMTATQIMTRRGGWPMSCFLEPAGLRPFWCGTYFPPEPRGQMAGFPQVLEGMSRAWREKRAEVIEQAGAVAAAVAEQLALRAEPVAVGLTQVAGATRDLLKIFDRAHGGFGSAPKFPQPVYLELLMDVRESAGDDATRQAIDQALRLTFDKMACGGMNDQVGGGFHRYSVDEIWLVPHFEKMLYDNAQLAAAYARAGSVYEDAFYSRVARRTLNYVLREMTSPEGGFSSAQDAEVDGREGLNYLWNPEEVREALQDEDAEFALEVYGLRDGPNFRDPHHPEAAASNILFLADRPERLVATKGLSAQEFLLRLDRVNAALYAARQKRKQPRLDDKVLLAWNGLMIGAMARAGGMLGEKRYVEAAGLAAEFVLARMRDEQGGLLRSYRAGKAMTPAFLEDYAFFVDGLLAMHDADAKAGRPLEGLAGAAPLAHARDLVDRARQLFGYATGGFFDTRDGQSDLFVRARTTHDGAIPSGSSVMLRNLIRLYELTGDASYLDSAIASVHGSSAAIADSPVATANATRGVLRLLALGHGERLAAFGPEVKAQDETPVMPVEVLADRERIQVGKDEPAELRLHLRIKEGYHLTAADPGPGGSGLVPLRIGVVHGSGIAAYANYPNGEEYGQNRELRVYKGSVEFDVAVERQGEWAGRPLLSVTYQACTESECLAPVIVELDVAVDRVD
jgi:uncharacterized protein YyaL (SSP411 family)